MDNIIYTPGIDVINELAAEAGCNCRVGRQWLKETANKVKETVTETVEEVKETVVAAFETVKDVWNATTEQEEVSVVEYCTEDISADIQEQYQLALDCGLVSTKLQNYIRLQKTTPSDLFLNLFARGELILEGSGLNKFTWRKANSTLSNAEYFKQNFMREEEVDTNDDYFSQYEEYETGDRGRGTTYAVEVIPGTQDAVIVYANHPRSKVTNQRDLEEARNYFASMCFDNGEEFTVVQPEEAPLTIQDVFGDRAKVLTSKGVFTDKSFKFLKRQLKHHPTVLRVNILSSYEKYLTKDQRRTLLNS